MKMNSLRRCIKRMGKAVRSACKHSDRQQNKRVHLHVETLEARLVPAIIISEVHPSGSGNGTYAADWFELTNTGASAVDITGWKMDDNSNAFASAVALRNLTMIPAGKSVVFFEGLTDGSTDATITAAFSNAWFGSPTPPAGFLIGAYGGSGVGLGNGGDAVNIYNSAGVLQANVVFGAATASKTFDNAAGLNNTTISQLSAVGVNGAFLSFNGAETGSPGTIVPTVTITAIDASASETGPDPGTFRIARTGVTTNSLTVSYTVATGAGQATSADYTPTLTGAATIAAGQSFVDIAITPVADAEIEGNETVTLTLVDTINYDPGTPSTATVTIADKDAPTTIDLSTYVRIGRYDLPEPTRTTPPAHSLLAQEASAVTYDWDTDSLFVVGDGGTSVVQVTKTGQLIDSMTLAPGNSPQGTDFYDTEGITYVGNGKFVLVEERDRQVNLFTYVPGGTLHRADVQTVKLGTFVDNIGIEGISYDPLTSGFIAVKETEPEGIFQTGIDFAAGTATNGSPTTVNSINLFDPALANLLDFADVYALSNLNILNGQAEFSHLLVLSQESGKIINIDRSGTTFSSLTIVSDPGNPLSVSNQQDEGLTMDGKGILYVVNENGGGDTNHPQLWVYVPSSTTFTNQAPIAVSLANPTTSLAEDANTATHIKLANIIVSDDSLGTNTLTLSGPDANSFEIVGTDLYLKAGTALDFETKASYSVTVNVDDTTVGSTPDASTAFTLAITDVTETPPTSSVIISEVAPWGSGNTPYAADWFEMTNIGTSAVNISGWKMDDNSNAFANAVALRGVASIPAGKSAIFLEGLVDGSTDAAIIASFKTAWFGSTPPAGLLIGAYGGSGVGLSTGADAVNLFDAGGNRVTGVSFGSSTTNFSFDNTAGLGSTTLPLPTISTLSVAGIKGAFLASDGVEVGSPGTYAPLIISEVSPWSSSGTLYNADWFEVTNTGAGAVDITGWKMDDNSNAFANAVALRGLTSIPAGKSAVFIEGDASGTTDATIIANFKTAWFGSTPPAGFLVGTYGGSGVGLSNSGDAVNLFDASGARVTGVGFGSSTIGFTFDNAAGRGSTTLPLPTISTLSAVGTNGAFLASDGIETGSPGTIVQNTSFAPSIQEITASTFVKLPATGAGFLSGVIGDPTDPAKTLGIDFTIADSDTPVANLTVTASSSNQAVVANANLALSGSGASRNLKITPTGVGYADITVTVSDGSLSGSYLIHYAASAASATTGTTRFHTDASDASAAIAVDANFMFVADDEDQKLRLFDRQNSGEPSTSFDFTSLLGLPEAREVDLEAATQVGNRIFWVGSESNSKEGDPRPNRDRIYATDLSGSGAAATLTYVGRYDHLKEDLIAWDQNNGHGLGANFLGLAASAATGVIPETADGSGFNIEGVVMKPGSNTEAYIAFRASLEPTATRTNALLVPVTNFASLAASNGPAGSATFGVPIQLDLGGRGIRDIVSNGTDIVIIAGPAGDTGSFALYTWTGNPADAPVLRNADLSGLNPEAIVAVPATLTSTTQLQLLSDNGDTIWYNDGVAAKDLPHDEQTKFRSDLVTLGASVESQEVRFAASSLTVSHAEGDAGATAFSFTITRTGGTTGAVDFTVELASSAATADDFVGGAALPHTINGTIAAGNSSAVITINVAGDDTIEADEDFSVTLTSVSNQLGVTTTLAASQTAATGTIVNDDFAPVATDVLLSTNEDTQAGGTLTASDLDSPALTYHVADGPMHGQVTINDPASGTFTYKPAANFSGSDSFTFTASDGSHDSNTATVYITINPVADAPNLSVAPAFGIQGVPVPLSIQSSLSDTDGSETLAITITGVPAGASLNHGSNQGLGKWELTPAQLAGLTLTGAGSGTFTLHVVATARETASNATASTSADLPVTVSGSSLSNGVLTILGTPQSDVIEIGKDHNQLTVYASFLPGNHTQTFNVSAITKIVVLLGDGDDVAVVEDDVKAMVLLDGGRGNDLLQAGGGDSVVAGGEGNDIVIGGKSRDILIGGFGSDILVGRGGQDILIGGATTYDANTTALFAALAEWARTDLDLAHRMAHLRTGGGLNGSTVFNSTTVPTVFDDQIVDILSGGSGSDWYWANLSQDILLGKKKSEIVN